MASRRKNGEGSWGTKTINGIKYKFYKDVNGNYFYGKTNAEINAKKDAYYEKYKDAKKSLKKVSAKYCYAAHESRLHQNDRCKRFTLCLVLTVRFRSLAPWGKLFQLFI